MPIKGVLTTKQTYIFFCSNIKEPLSKLGKNHIAEKIDRFFDTKISGTDEGTIHFI